ncbi:MAG: hypothetical protein FWE29_00860 [Defluviitaleaceae bacterium]|nr:hypothetical protein [Defluviitaleaceae bacterium]
MAKHMFAGASSPIGFIDFFHSILPLDKAKERYFLKGSSGSGKSTFIKKIAAEFEAKGFNAEKFHCANDADSLDAVSIPDKGISIIDATLPHSHDPEIPAAIDKIIDFAMFLDGNKVNKYLDEIKPLLQTKKVLYQKSLSCFASLGEAYLAGKATRESALSLDYLNELAEKTLRMFDVHKAKYSPGADRKLFLSALTPDGYVSFAGEFFDGCKVYGLCSEEGIGADIFLGKLRDEFNRCGINTESFYFPIAPDRLEYLYLPEIKSAFSVAGSKFSNEVNIDKKIDMCHCVDTKKISRLRPKKENCLFDKMLNETITSMKTAKATHTRIEEIYAEAMDFEKIDILTEGMLRKLVK